MSDHEHEEESHGGGHGGHGGGHGHGGGGHEEGHEGAPEWLISFADNVALMMGFFVILLAMKMNLKSAEPASASAGGADSEEVSENSSEEALLDMAIAIREAFNNPVDIHSTNPRDLALIKRIMGRQQEGKAFSPGQEGHEREVRSLRPSDYVSFGGKVAFEQGQATLSAGAVSDIGELAARLRGRRTVVEVHGHASAAEAYQTTDRGMALSYQRALATAEELVRQGVGWDRLRIIASADNDRISQVAYDARGHQANQRVEVIETDRATAGDAPASGDSPPTSGPASSSADSKPVPPAHGGH